VCVEHFSRSTARRLCGIGGGIVGGSMALPAWVYRPSPPLLFLGEPDPSTFKCRILP